MKHDYSSKKTTLKMNEKKVRPNNIEQQSNVNKNTKKPTEVFVLSPLFLQNLGISIKDITHEEETSCVGTNKYGANIDNERKKNYFHDTSVSKKVQYDETSMVETANLMKNSVFMSPTFVPSDNNDSVVENVKPKEFDTANNINANEELILNRNVSEDTIGVQIKTLGDVNRNDVCQKNIDDTQSLTECASVAIVIDNPIPIGNTEPNDYASNYSITNEQDSREMSISNDAISPYGYYIYKSNSQTQDTDIVFSQSTDTEEVHFSTDSSSYQKAINNECQVISDEVGKKSNKESDSFQNQISYSDKIDKECTESLNLKKKPGLVSDNLIELNELIVGNNSIISNMSKNGNTNECEISKLIATDLMDFEGVDNVSLQIIENEKNNHLHLGKLSDKVFSEEKQFGHLNENSCNENQNDVSVHCLYSRNKDDVDKDMEGAQCDHSSNNTKVDLCLKLRQIEKHEQSSPSSVDVNTEFRQFTTSYQNQCSKEVDVPSALKELNKRHFMDNSKDVAFVHSQVQNIENENLRSTDTGDHTEENELKNYSSSASTSNETVGENAENNFVIQEMVNLLNSSTLNSTDKHSVNDNIRKTEIYTTNSDCNASLLRDKDGIFGVSKPNYIEIKKQPRRNRAVLCGKLKGVPIKKQEIKKSHDHESENSSAASSTHQNQCFLTDNEPKKCETNVNLIATYLKQITQMHTQGPKPKSYKKSKKMVSKISVQGVEKPGGSKLIQKPETRFHFDSSNLSIKKTYHRKHVLNKKTVVVNPITNKIYNESPCQNCSLDYIEKPVSTDIKMGFCICVDYGHIFYDTSYTDLEHLHYSNKISGDFNSHDFVTDHSVIDFKSFSDETSKVSKDVTETPDPQTSSICWKNTEELIEQNKFNEALGSDDVIMSSEKFIETKVGSLNILNNVSGETVNILNIADSETSYQQSCCLDPKVHRTGLVYGANAFLSVVEKGSVQSSNLGHENDPFGYEINLTDEVHIKKEIMESDDSLMLLNSGLIDSSMDGKMQSTDTPDITLPVTFSSNQSPHHFMNINDEHDNKMLRMTVDDSDQNEMNTNSDQEFESQCPEFLSCDICNLIVKTEEWINHKCLSNSVHFEENGNISEVSAINYEECDEKQNSKESVRKEKLAIVPHVTEEDRPVFECTCGVCYQVIDINSWISHIQKEHDYLAWQKDETPIDFSTIERIKEHLVKICKTFGLLICKHCGLKQKRYRRSYEKYIEVYLDHVELCGNQLSQVSNVAEKIQNLSSNQDDIVTEDTNNRLSVNASRLSEFDEKDFEIEQNFVCGVCEQTVENIEWTNHIQIQHNYLAWKKGDTEINFNSSSSIKEHLINVSKTSGLLICKHCGLKQKRHRRSYDRYIDIYLEHVELCARRVLSDVTEKTEEIPGSQNSDINAESNNSLTANDSTMSVTDTKNGEIKENIICGVCEQAVDNTEWLKHIQLQHNYFAWKKGDPELDLKDTYKLQEYLVNLCSNIRYLFCNKCGLKINRYLRTDQRYVQCFMEHIVKCNPDVKNVSQDSCMNDSRMNCDNTESSLVVKNSSEETSISNISENIPSVTCGVCHEVVQEKLWIEHTKIKHNYIAWPQGAASLDLNNSEEIESFLVELTKKIGSLSCYKCDVKLKRYRRTYENYIKSFLNHVEECNYNAVSKEKNEAPVVTGTVSCAICSHEMNQDEWNNHLLHKHYNLAWRKGLDKPLDLQNDADIVRKLKEYNKYRKMTCNNCGISRASIMGFFAHIVTCKKTKEEIAPFQFKCEICGASSLKVYYQQHMAAHKVQEFNEEKKKLKLEAPPKEEQITVTVPSGKRKAAHKAMAVLEKYTACKYKCEECEFKTDCKQELISHKCDVGGSCVDSEDSADLSLQSSNESSDEEDENLSDEENQTINKRKRNKSSGHKYFTLPFNVKNVDAYLKDGYNKFMKAHYTSDTLFDEWLHCPYLEVSSDEVQKYLPPLTESCKIKFDGHWDSYKLFEARERKGYSLFMGGCISCMAWAPGPTNALQMLAVATYHSNDTPRFSYDTIHEHPGLIQIWSCGSLGNKLPYFSLGIAHDFGTVWAMEWCPSGAQTPLPEDSSYTTRLGLLAVACSNGLVYIFSVPHPSTMPSKYCKLQPVAELRFWTSSEHPNHQATAINWSKQKGHSVIAVGYSDGITAMFNLKVDSPILKHKEGNTTIFYPYSDDYSFNSSITGISIYPTMEAENTGLEVIGCSSTTGAMLQVKTAGGPAHVVYSKTAINGADFMLHWPALFISMDDITPTKPLSELEVWGLGRRAGGARVVAICACCPRLFSWSPPLVRTARVHPLYDDMKKSPVAVIEMVSFKGEGQKPKKQKVNDDLSFKVEPTVYDEAILKYGIRFQFINSAKRQRTGTKPSRMARPDLYPLADVRAFAVCPSPVRHNWLAIGLHAGFVFIIRT